MSSKQESLIESGSLFFTVDAASCLRQVEADILEHGIAAHGMAMGLAIIRQTLYKIGEHALKEKDKELIVMLEHIGVLKPVIAEPSQAKEMKE